MSKTAALISTLAPALLALLGLAFYAAEIFILTFHPVPAANRDVVTGAVGYIGGSLVGAAFGFYFGASLHAKDGGAAPAPDAGGSSDAAGTAERAGTG